MTNASIRIAAFSLLLIGSLHASSSSAQESLFDELTSQQAALFQQGRYMEAIPFAAEAVKLAEAHFCFGDPSFVEALWSLAALYNHQGLYADAEPLYRRILDIEEKATTPDPSLIAKTLTSLASIYNAQHKFADAEPLLRRALDVEENALEPDNPKKAITLNTLAFLDVHINKYFEAESLYRQALRIGEKSLGPDHPDVAVILDGLGMVYFDLGKYSDAESLVTRGLSIRENALGPNHPDVAMSLNNLEAIYEKEARYAEAEPLLKRSLSIKTNLLGPDHPSVATALANLAWFYYQDQGRYTEAESLFQRALDIDEKALGSDNPAFAFILNNFGALYDAEGNYGRAELLFDRALSIQEKTLGPDHTNVASTLSNLALLYHQEGKYAKAESLYERALKIREKELGSGHPDVGLTVNGLASLYEDQGKYAEAESLYKRALSIQEETLGPNHPYVASTINNLGSLYEDQGKFVEAEPLLKRSLDIREKVLGTSHPDFAIALNNLAVLYQYQVRYGDAEPLFKRALSIQEKTLGPDCITVAATLNSLAVLYQNKANYTEAESLFKRALGIRKKALGNDHSDVGQSLYNLASFYDNQGRYVEAEPLYRQAFDNIFDQFQSTFTYMTERERLGFLDRINTTGSFPAFFSFVHRFHGADPALAGSMYNLLLWEKGLVAGSVENMRRQVEASGDPDALNLFTQLADKRRQIAALLRLNPSDLDLWRKQVDELQAGANDIERNLVARSSALAEKKKLDRATWQQVRDALQPGDAAVEFVNFRFFDKKWTEVSYYVALVVTRETKNQPEYIFLGDDREIEGSAVVPFLRSVQTRPFVDEQEANLAGAHVYGVIWKPLEKALAGKTRIYLSPDGTLYEVPFGVIPSPDGKLQIEKYDLRLLSSTRDIFLSAPQKVGATALLVGDPVFNVSEEQQRVAMKELTLLEQEAPVQMAILSPNDVSRDPGKGFPLQRLPGTGDEVNAIADLMRERGWKSDLYTKERALKRVVERTDSPKVVHLATHGFFLPDQQIKSYRTDLGHTQPSRLEDPMLRSGLYFAGADRTLAGKPTPEDLDNGILTAAEAGSLNLRGAELVVLSACNTGLGDVKNGEGVFGLRRALQEAGAQSVLMSLWPVPDNHTLELMKRFYSNWLSGMEIHESLKEAQLEMRKRVRMNHEGRDLPYYWGAFVLVGR